MNNVHDMSIPVSRNDTEDTPLFPEESDVTTDLSQEGWFHGHDEGQLSVDVIETPKEIVVRSAIAGVQPEDLELFVHNDMLTIRGKRESKSTESDGRMLVHECHWGSFSRSIILPTDIDTEQIAATLKNGVLTVRLPKVERTKRISVKKL